MLRKLILLAAVFGCADASLPASGGLGTSNPCQIMVCPAGSHCQPRRDAQAGDCVPDYPQPGPMHF